MAGVVVHTYNPSTHEAEAGGLQVPSQPGLHIETLPVSTKQNKTKKKRKERQTSQSLTLCHGLQPFQTIIHFHSCLLLCDLRNSVPATLRCSGVGSGGTCWLFREFFSLFRVRR
jgi:hypothetical protein